MRTTQSTHANLSTVIKLLMILSLALLIQACDDDKRPPRPEDRTGGMVMTTETPVAEGDVPAPVADAPADAPAEPTPTPEPTPAPLSVGQLVTSTAQVRLYADATTSSAVLEVYESPALFSVMEPSAEYDQYPVASASGVWYRVRAADGLAGWAQADALIGQ